MKGQPFFSVIIPTYNRERAVLRSIKSVLNQSFSDFEIIVVDDGSTDNTQRAIEPLLGNPKLRYIYQENSERSAARNNGITNSSGQFICFLDSDDEYTPNHLQKVYDSLENNRFRDAIYYCNGLLRVTGKEDKNIFSAKHLPTDDRNNVEFIASSAPIGTVFVCLPRKSLNQEQFDPSIRVGEDKELWARLAKNLDLVHCNHHTVIVHEHEGRTVHPSNYISAKESVNTLKIILVKGGGEIRKKWQKKALAAAYYGLAKSYGNSGYRFKASINALWSLVLFRDQYSTSILVFIMKNAGLGFILPKHLKANS